MIDASQFIRLEGTILQWSEVAAIVKTNGETTKCTLILKSGAKLYFSGFEAGEVWKMFDPDGDWQNNS